MGARPGPDRRHGCTPPGPTGDTVGTPWGADRRHGWSAPTLSSCRICCTVVGWCRQDDTDQPLTRTSSWGRPASSTRCAIHGPAQLVQAQSHLQRQRRRHIAPVGPSTDATRSNRLTRVLGCTCISRALRAVLPLLVKYAVRLGTRSPPLLSSCRSRAPRVSSMKYLSSAARSGSKRVAYRPFSFVVVPLSCAPARMRTRAQRLASVKALANRLSTHQLLHRRRARQPAVSDGARGGATEPCGRGRPCEVAASECRHGSPRGLAILVPAAP